MSMAGPYALDFGAVLSMGAAMDADLSLLAAALPGVERAILDGLTGETDGGEDG